jgi:hypothetical protein
LVGSGSGPLLRTSHTDHVYLGALKSFGLTNLSVSRAPAKAPN